MKKNDVLGETILKEINSQRKWKEEHKDMLDTFYVKQEERRKEIRSSINKNVQEEDNLRKSIEGSKERRYLFQGISKDGEGRAAYLKFREKKDPQERYLVPQTAAQEIGWTVGKKDFKLLKNPDYGKKGTLKKDFYSSGGVF